MQYNIKIEENYIGKTPGADNSEERLNYKGGWNMRVQ